MTLFVYNRLYASPHRYIVVFCDNTGQTTAVSWYLAISCSRLLPWRISLTLRASLGLPKMRSTLRMVRGSPSHRLVHDFLDLISVLRVHISNSISIISAVLAQFTLVTKRQIDKQTDKRTDISRYNGNNRPHLMLRLKRTGKGYKVVLPLWITNGINCIVYVLQSG